MADPEAPPLQWRLYVGKPGWKAWLDGCWFLPPMASAEFCLKSRKVAGRGTGSLAQPPDMLFWTLHGTRASSCNCVRLAGRARRPASRHRPGSIRNLPSRLRHQRPGLSGGQVCEPGSDAQWNRWSRGASTTRPSCVLTPASLDHPSARGSSTHYRPKSDTRHNSRSGKSSRWKSGQARRPVRRNVNNVPPAGGQNVWRRGVGHASSPGRLSNLNLGIAGGLTPLGTRWVGNISVNSEGGSPEHWPNLS